MLRRITAAPGVKPLCPSMRFFFDNTNYSIIKKWLSPDVSSSQFEHNLDMFLSQAPFNAALRKSPMADELRSRITALQKMPGWSEAIKRKLQYCLDNVSPMPAHTNNFKP